MELHIKTSIDIHIAFRVDDQLWFLFNYVACLPILQCFFFDFQDDHLNHSNIKSTTSQKCNDLIKQSSQKVNFLILMRVTNVKCHNLARQSRSCNKFCSSQVHNNLDKIVANL